MRTLYIISDLHLGGRPHDTTLDGCARPGFQFNHAYAALIEFIDWVAAQASSEAQTELVINGDIVDFLAEDDYQAGVRTWMEDEHEAIQKLDLIAQRTRNGGSRGVFDALRDLVRGGARLTLLLGNHDIELSLPAVRSHLLGLLGGECGRLRFIYDGEAYLTDRVLIEHGNRYDRWNRIDYNGLRQERSDRSRARRPAAPYFRPPAGTCMVIDVLNRIKGEYRFIDLLKPETGAALPLLVALEPSLAGHLYALVRAHLIRPLVDAGGVDAAGQPAKAGYMSRDSPLLLDDIFVEELGHENARLFSDAYGMTRPAALSADLMSITGDDPDARAQAWWHTVTEPVHTAADGIAALWRQAGAAISDLRWRQLHVALRQAAARDASFDPQQEEAAAYRNAAESLVAGGGIDVVVNGHTHLPKKVRLHQPGRRCWYLNTGTWCDVLRLPVMPRSFDEARAILDPFVAALGANTLDQYIQRYLSWVEVRIAPGSTPEPSLYSYCGPGRERCPPLTAYTTPSA